MSLRKFWVFFLTGLFVCEIVCAKQAEELYTKYEHPITMRDGVRLYTAVYVPRSGEIAPILILRTPYGCRPYGADEFAPGLEQGYLRNYIDRGYILVMQDVRGRYMSEGEYVNVRPAGAGAVDETTDSYDTVDWLVNNIEENNGRVGFVGCSYLGFYAMMGGLSGHPAVKAISPQAPVTDWFMGDDTHHNGVLMLTDSYRFIPGMSHAGEHVPTPKMPSKRKIPRTPNEYDFFLRHLTLDSLSSLLEPTPFWEEMAAHPDYDAWWQARDVRRACYNVRPAVLVVGGAFDAEDGFGAWNTYKAIRRQSPATDCRLVVGPWSHGAWQSGDGRLGRFDFGPEAGCGYYMEHFELPFFDYYLRGMGLLDELPAVSVFVSGTDCWHSFGQWPPENSKKTTFYLTDGGGISEQLPQTKRSLSSYISDPLNPVPYNNPLGEHRDKAYMLADQRFVAGREDVLTFVSEPLPDDKTLLGAVTASLEVALSTTDADFVVKLVDVFPDGDKKAGYEMLVRGEVMRGRYRKGFSRPEPFVPGKSENVTFVMPDIAHTFRKGHRLMVQVQSSWFPLAERSPQQFVDLWHCTAADFIPCTVQLFHQRDRASSVTVRVEK